MSNGGGVGVGVGLVVFTAILLLLMVYGVETGRAVSIALIFGVITALLTAFGRQATQ